MVGRQTTIQRQDNDRRNERERDKGALSDGNREDDEEEPRRGRKPVEAPACLLSPSCTGSEEKGW